MKEEDYLYSLSHNGEMKEWLLLGEDWRKISKIKIELFKLNFQVLNLGKIQTSKSKS